MPTATPSAPAGAPQAAPQAGGGGTDVLWWRLSALVVLAATAARAALALGDHSIYWPDELYQTLEQAHRVAFGTGFIPWEFRDGARNWLLPGVVAGLWRVAAGLGVESPLALVALARLGVVLGSALAIWLSARLGAALAGARAGFVAALWLAVLPASLVFSYRTLSESLSAPLIVGAALLLTARSPRRGALAGAAVALGTLLRYQNALFGLAFLGWLAAERRGRELLFYSAAGAATLLAGGLLDWASWGRPFHSLLTYVDFNLLQGGASTFGVEPFGYYGRSLWTSTGPAAIVLGLLALAGGWRAPALGLALLANVLVHCLIPHKELRFLVPALPLLCALAGVGAESVLERARPPAARWAWLALGASLLATIVRLPHLTFRQLGQYLDTPRGTRVIWNADAETNLLLAEAGEQPDLCGLGALGLRPAFTGGYTYLHRSVPLLYEQRLCGAEPLVNYVLVPFHLAERLLPAGYTLVRERGWLGLFRRDGGCEPPPAPLDPLLDGAHDMGLDKPLAEQAPDGSVRFNLLRDAGSFVSGWGNGELAECLPARWLTGRRSVAQFRASAPDQPEVIRTRLSAYDGDAPQRLRISLNGQGVYEGELPVTPTLVTADVPALRRGQNELVFELSQTWEPGGDDTRELGALLGSLELVPLVDDFHFEVGAEADTEHFVSGFSPPELEGRRVGFAWNDGPVSVVEGRLATPERAHLLSLLVQGIQGVNRARLSLNDHPLRPLELTPEWSFIQRVVPPELLRRGTNRLRFEYESTVRPAALYAGASDQRDLAARFRSIALDPLPATEVLDLGTPEARGSLLDGWSGDETEDKRSVVWTLGGRARFHVWLAPGRDAQLRVDARAFPPALPLNVEVRLNDGVAGSFRPQAAWGSYEIVLPGKLASDERSVVELRFDHTAKPSEHEPGSLDTRELALRVDRLTVVR